MRLSNGAALAGRASVREASTDECDAQESRQIAKKANIKHIMEKLGATDRTQAVAIGVRRGIIQL